MHLYLSIIPLVMIEYLIKTSGTGISTTEEILFLLLVLTWAGLIFTLRRVLEAHTI